MSRYNISWNAKLIIYLFGPTVANATIQTRICNLHEENEMEDGLIWICTTNVSTKNVISMGSCSCSKNLEPYLLVEFVIHHMKVIPIFDSNLAPRPMVNNREDTKFFTIAFLLVWAI